MSQSIPNLSDTLTDEDTPGDGGERVSEGKEKRRDREGRAEEKTRNEGTESSPSTPTLAKQ